MYHHKIFIGLIGLIFCTMVAVFNFLPRSTYSEIERRELASFPSFSLDSLSSGAFMRDVSAWFSDTEPLREEFMLLNMSIKSSMAYRSLIGSEDDDDEISYIAGDAPASKDDDNEDTSLEAIAESAHNVEGHTTSQSAAEENATMGKSGILVVGKEPKARALMIYGAPAKAASAYANAVKAYKEELGSRVKVYCMPIPTSIEFYCPDKAKKLVKPEIATINHIYDVVSEAGVIGVDCYTPLSEHSAEDIYLRTDHHWAPLGAYYAAQAFAKAAGVPFADLSTYEMRVVHDFVGTMYGYSGDIAVKRSPEDFVYYMPQGVEYTSTMTNYNVDKDMRIIGKGKPQKSRFFFHYKDGNGGAYSTFMGGDMKIVNVHTSTKNGRRLLILKDSFGNALPGYLFHSFEDIHVVDFRYFTSNIKDYIHKNGITDVLFANGIFNSCGKNMPAKYMRFLSQAEGSGIYTPSAADTKPAAPKDSSSAPQPTGVPAKVEESNSSESSESTENSESSESSESSDNSENSENSEIINL